jgi:hypothetical protein
MGETSHRQPLSSYPLPPPPPPSPLAPRHPPQPRAARVAGSTLSDALCEFRAREKEWAAERAALRRDADAGRKARLAVERQLAKAQV